MEEQREEELEELDLALESLWVEVRRVGKEKGILFFVFVPFGLGLLWWSFVVVVVVVG